MNSTRRHLPQRRHCRTFKLKFGKHARTMHITVGYYGLDDKEPGEIFISGSKSGEEFEAICRDSAVLLSLCLQHGVALEVIKSAITRNADATPSTIVGAVVDKLADKEVK